MVERVYSGLRFSQPEYMMQQIPIPYPSRRTITDIGVKDEQRGGGEDEEEERKKKMIQCVDARVNLC